MRIRVGLVLTLVGALAIGGCNKGSSTDNSAGLTGEPIKIMTINPLTKAASVTPTVPIGAQAAAAAINKAGGVNGRPIEVTPCDDQGDPNLAATCAREAKSKGMVAVVGMIDNLGASYVPLLNDAGIPIVGGYPVAGPDLTSPNVFPTAGGIAVTLVGAGDLVADDGLKNVAFMYQAFQGSDAYVNYFTKGLQQNGLSIHQKVAVDATAADMAPFVATALQGGTDGIVIVTGGAAAVKLVRGIREAGSNAQIVVVGAAATAPESLQAMGSASQGLQSLAPCKPDTTTGDAAVDKFNTEMKAFKSDAPTDYNAALGYSSVYLFAHAAGKAADISAKGIMDAMPSVSNFDTGICGPVSFGQPLPQYPDLTRVFNPNMVFTKIQDNTIVPVTGKLENVFR